MRMNTAGQSVSVVGICGSIRPGSFTRTALQVALQGAQEVGAQTGLIDLNDYNLVFCDGGTELPGRYRSRAWDPSPVSRLHLP